MKELLRSPTFVCLRQQTGMALVITLSMVVLVTIAAMAFFARATLNTAIESSRASQVLAEQLSATATDYAVSQFLQEMTNNVQVLATTNAVSTYQVTNAVGMVPLRALAQAAMTTDTNFVNLVRQSVPGADNNASGDSTATAAQNGRLVSPNRWNAPSLLGSSGFTSTNQLPSWIYVNKDGSVSATASTNAVGRFAYNAYDTSGLVDANVAGYPSSISGTNLAILKGTLAGMDLSLIPGIGTTNNMDKFVGWRNTNHVGSSSSYVTAVTNAATNGFLSPLAGDQRITSRQDLIKIARSGNYGITTNALPFLTHFSRELNAPSFAYPGSVPTSSLANTPIASSSVSPQNRSPLNFLFTAAGSSPDGFSWAAGTPVMPRRFPLSRLALVTFNATASAGSDIQRYFGLYRTDDGNDWTYTGSSGTTTAAAGIKTLDVVASENREPNFFEVLKACIHQDSLGVAVPQTSAPNQYIVDGLKDLQILRIGANIIDQYDSDSYPTRITYSPIVPGYGAVGLVACGIENLPYLAKFHLKILNPSWPNDAPGTPSVSDPTNFSTNAAASGTLDPWPYAANPTNALAPKVSTWDFSGRRLDAYIIPELVMPHTTNTVPYVGPSRISVSAVGEVVLQAANKAVGTRIPTMIGASNGQITVAQSAFADFFPYPRMARSLTGISASGNFTNVQTGTGGTNDVNCNVLGLRLPFPSTLTIPISANPSDYPNQNSGQTVQAGLGGPQGFDFVLKYLDHKGMEKRYNQFTGVESSDPVLEGVTRLGYTSDNIGVFAWGGNYQRFLAVPVGKIPGYILAAVIQSNYSFFKTDPRTSRIGAVNTIGTIYDLPIRPELGDPPPTVIPLGFLMRRPNPTQPSLTHGSLFPTIPPSPPYSPIQNFYHSETADMSSPAQGIVGRGRWGCDEFAPWPGTTKLYTHHASASSIYYNSGWSSYGYWFPAMLSENRDTGDVRDTFYYDNGPTSAVNSGRVRPADAVLIGLSTDPVTQSALNIYNNQEAFPKVLNRPFRSVGELGYAFRDMPYKTLDFFSVDSVDAALLDAFTLSSTPSIRAGVVNFNTPHPEVLQALLTGTDRNETNNVTPAEAATVAAQFSADMPATAAKPPLCNISELVTIRSTTNTTSVGGGTWPAIKSQREAYIRAASGVANQRTWNILVDAIAQSGRFPNSAGSSPTAASFIVDGEQRIWLSTALDRLTGRIIDSKTEVISE